jgi:hypothetical protein
MLRLLIFALLVFSSLSHAQSTVGIVRTGEMSNGRLWASMSPDIKTMYLTGIKDILIATKPPEESQYLPGRYSVAEITKSIDHFYESPENALIPVVFALRVCVMKFNGASPALIDAVVTSMRKAIAEEAAQPHKDR